MSIDNLTKDSQVLFAVLYREYLNRRKAGIGKEQAKTFKEGSKEIHSNLMPKWSFEDVDETCRELSRAGFLDSFYADDITYLTKITDKGIIVLENKFPRGLQSLAKFLIEISSLIVPFI